MGNYDPLTTLRGWQGVSEIQNARVDRRARLAQLAEQERQMKEQQSIRDAAKASVTNVPGQSADLGTFRAGGADLPMGSVGMAPHSEFDTQGFSGRLKAINPLMGQEYDQNQAAIDQKQQDAQLDRQKKLVDLQNGFADLVAKKGTAAKTDLDNVISATKYQAQLASMVKGAAPENKEQAFQYARKAVMDHPQLAQFAQQLPEHYTPELEPFLDSIITGAVDVQKVAEKASENLGPKAEERYRKVLANISAGTPVTQEDYDFAKGYEASNTKSTTQSDTLGVTSNNVSRPSGLASVGRPTIAGGGGLASTSYPQSKPSPSQTPYPKKGSAQTSVKDNIVDMVGQYRYNPTQLTRLAAKHPELLAAINEKYPDWDQTTYQAKAKLMQDYTSGTHSKEINAINTAMGHVAELGDAIDALDNGDIKFINSLANKLQIQTGGTAAATVALIARRVAPEIATVYTPTGGGQTERIADEKDFDFSLGKDILKKNVSKTVDLLRSKIGALETQYKNTVGRDDFDKRFITPAATAALQKYSTQGGGGQQHAPGAKVSLPDGTTGKGSDGKGYIVKGGVWVSQ